MPPRRTALVESTPALDMSDRSTRDLVEVLDNLANAGAPPQRYDLDVPYLDVEGLAKVWSGLGHLHGVGEA